MKEVKGIPIPAAGYWTKVNVGKPVERTPLSDRDNDEITVSVGTQETTEPMLFPPPASAEAIREDGKIGLVLPEPPKGKYDRQTLYEEVWAEPMTKVSKRYGMGDNGLRKVCRSMYIPFPDRGYWAKVQAGKPVSKTPLPKIKPPQVDRKDLPKTGAERELQIEESALSFLKSDDREKILKAAWKLRVAGPGSSLHKDIEKHKQECEEWLERESKREYAWRYQVDPPLFADTMSKSSYNRAYHILDALVKALLPFGGGLAYDFSLKVNGETVKFGISEAKDEIPHEMTQAERMALLKYEAEQKKHSWASKPKIPKYDHPWSGRLCFTIGDSFKFRDCRSYDLEDRIGEMLVALYEASWTERCKRLEKEEKERREHEEYLRREAVKKRYNDEVDRLYALINEAKDYQSALCIRAYADARERAGDVDAQWFQWAREKAD